MACFTTDVIATCAFGIESDALQNPETSEFRKMGKLSFQLTLKRRLQMMILLISRKLFNKLGMKFTAEESSIFFRNFVKDMLERREAAIEKGEGESKGYGDFIHHLVMLKKRGLHSTDLKDKDDETEHSGKQENYRVKGKIMTEDVEKGLLLCDWRVLVSLTAVAIVALYFYLMSSFDYWKKRGFPEVSGTPLPFFGHTLGLFTGRTSFTDIFEELYEAAGDHPFAGYYQGSQPSLLVKDPDLIKHILIKDFHVFMNRAFELDEEIDPLSGKGLANLKGQRWKDMRARLSPTFTSGRMKAMFPIMKACSDELIQSLKSVGEKTDGVAIFEAKEYLACYSTDVIATCAFGIHCDALQNPETSEFRKMGKLSFKTTWKRKFLLALLLISPKLLKKLGIRFTDDESSVFFRNFVKDMMERREAAIEKGEGKGYGDFIYHLVMLKKRGLHSSDLKDDNDEDEIERVDGGKEAKEQIKEEPSWTNLTLDDLAAQVMQFFSAGFETTSSLLSFALFELSSSEHGKAVQKKLREEVDRVMEEDGGEITYDGLKRMQLLDRVLNETLRIYPPGPILSRVSLQPYTIPGTNLQIEKETHVFMSTKAMQRDEKFFPNPMHFDPDRFLPEQKGKMNQFLFLPFGEGPRICIGQRFAQMQIRLGLAALISKFGFDICLDKTSLPLKLKKSSFILTAETGIWVKARKHDGKY